MFILFDLMTLTYSATLTFPVALPDLYKASRAIYVPVRPIPALSMYKITSQLIEKPKKLNNLQFVFLFYTGFEYVVTNISL